MADEILVNGQTITTRVVVQEAEPHTAWPYYELVSGGTYTCPVYAGAGGGAVYVEAGGTITGNNVAFVGNTTAAWGSGGAIYNAGTATFTGDVAFIGNTITGGYGGAISNVTTLTLNSATFSNNVAGEDGGAIWNQYELNITGDATFTGNTATGKGGAIYTNGGTINFTGSSVTFSGNTSTKSGGAIYNYGGAINFAGTIDLATESDTWVNNWNTTVNWDISNGLGQYASITNFERYSNDSADVKQRITVSADQEFGDYVIATGDLTDLTNKNTFTVKTADDATGVQITVGDTFVKYGDTHYYSLTNVDNAQLVLSVVDTSKRVVVQEAEPHTAWPYYELVSGGTYTCPVYTEAGGGAVEVIGGTVTGNNVAFVGNTTTAWGSGGAIYNAGTATFTGDVTFDGNTTANGDGGALYNGLTTTLSNATFTGNAAGGRGGAIFHMGSTLTLNSATFSNNVAVEDGGAIWNQYELNITGDATFTGNTATGKGGAIYNYGGTISFTGSSVTFSGNTATGKGGAIYNYGGVINFAGTIDLATESDTWVNNGSSARVYWDISNGLDQYASITNFERYSRASENGQLITVSADQELGTYVIATGDLTDLTNKSSFTLTGVSGLDNVTITVGSTARYNGLTYALANVDNAQLVLTVADTSKRVVVQEAEPHTAWPYYELVSGGTYTCPVYTQGGGGAVYVATGGTITGNNVAFVGNTTTADGSGAIYNGGTATFTGDATFIGNTTTGGDGGAISNVTTMTFNSATFSNNVARSQGGAIYNHGDMTFAGDATFTGNMSYDDLGGAIYNFGGTATFTGDATFSNNVARSWGGAIFNYCDMTFASDATFTGNTSGDWGGAIYTSNGTISFTGSSVTFSGNTATIAGGAIFNSNGTINFAGTIDLATESDTWVNNSGRVNWDISNGLDQYASITNFERYSNDSADVKQMITVSADQELGTYVIATGDLSSLAENVKTFRITGVSGQKDASITVGSAANYNGLTYVLTNVDNAQLVLSLVGTDTRIVVQEAAPHTAWPYFELLEGGTYTCPVYAGDGGALYVDGGTVTGNNVTFAGNTVVQSSGGAVYMNGGTAIFTNVNFTNNSAADGYGGAVQLKAGTAVLANVTFSSNIATDGGAMCIYGADAVAVLAGTLTLATNTDTLLNGGSIYWDLTQDNVMLNGYQYLQNGGALYLKVDSDVKLGDTFTIATGDLTDLTNKSSFTLTGVTGQDDATITVGSSARYNGLTYVLTNVDNAQLVLSLVDTNTRVVVQEAEPHTAWPYYELVSGGTYTCPVYTQGGGGAVYVATGGTITGNNVAFVGNTTTADGSGAIYNGGTATFTGDVTFIGNTTTGGDGGAISNDTTMTFNSATFSNNVARSQGGAIYNHGDMTFAGDVTFTGNMSYDDLGGAIHSYGGTATFTGDATFSNNVARSWGGAIFNYSDMTFASDATFTGNTSGGWGGAIYTSNYTISFTGSSVTFAGNTATIAGGAIFNSNGTINFAGTIDLATESDTWVNNSGRVNWDISNGLGQYASITNFERYSNDSADVKQTITVSADQELGTYVIATGDLTDLTNKNSFTITGVSGLDDVTIMVGGTASYNGFNYTLTNSGSNLELTVSDSSFDYIIYVCSDGKLRKNDSTGEEITDTTITDHFYFSGGTWTMSGLSFTTTAATALEIAADTDTVITVDGVNNLVSANATNNIVISSFSANLTLQGSGTLDVTAGDADASSVGFQGSTLTLNDDVKLNLTAGSSSGNETGLTVSYLYVNGGTIVAQSNAANGIGISSAYESAIDSVAGAKIVGQGGSTGYYGVQFYEVVGEAGGESQMTDANGNLLSYDSNNRVYTDGTTPATYVTNRYPQYTLTGTSATAGGGVIFTVGGVAATEAQYNATVTVQAIEVAGYTCTGFTSDQVTITDNEFTMPGENVTVTAIYEAAPMDYTIYLCADGSLRKNDAQGDIITDTAITDHLSYDSGSGFWTMSDLSFTTTAGIGMATESSVAITVDGTNELISGNSDADGFGFQSLNNTITLNGTGSFSITASSNSNNCAFAAGGLGVNGGVTLTLNSIAGDSTYALYLDGGNLEVAGSTITACAQDSKESYGIRITSGTATVGKGSVITSEGTSMGYSATGPVTTDGTTEAKIYDINGNELTWEDGTYVNGGAPSTYITNVKAAGNDYTIYLCSNGDLRKNDAEGDLITDTAITNHLSYDTKSSAWTMSGLSFTTTANFGITSGDDVTLTVTGTNVVNVNSTSNVLGMDFSKSTLALNGTGSLSISTTVAGEETTSTGLYAQALTISGVTLEVNNGSCDNAAYALYTEGNFTVTSGTISAINSGKGSIGIGVDGIATVAESATIIGQGGNYGYRGAAAITVDGSTQAVIYDADGNELTWDGSQYTYTLGGTTSTYVTNVEPTGYNYYITIKSDNKLYKNDTTEEITDTAITDHLSYNEKSATWTMSNFTFDTTAAFGIRVDDGVSAVITVDGTNSLIAGSSDTTTATIYFCDDLVLQGTGDLTVTSRDTTATYSAAIANEEGTGTLTINGITLNATAGSAATISGAIQQMGECSLVIQSGTVHAVSGSGTYGYGTIVGGATTVVESATFISEGVHGGFFSTSAITTDGTTEATIYDADGNELTWETNTYTLGGTPATYITNVASSGYDFYLRIEGNKLYKSDTSEEITDTAITDHFSYDTENKAWAMTDLNFETTASYAIRINDDSAVITVDGNNSIISGSSGSGETCGIYFNTLTLQSASEGTLNVTSVGQYSYGLYGTTLTVDGLTLNVTTGAASATDATGIEVTKALTVNNGTVSGIGGATDARSVGINTTTITATNSVITGQGADATDQSIGITGTTITATGSTISGYASEASESVGIQVNGIATVSDGVITGEGSVMGYQGNNPITTDGTTEATIYDSDGNALSWSDQKQTYTDGSGNNATYITNQGGAAYDYTIYLCSNGSLRKNDAQGDLITDTAVTGHLSYDKESATWTMSDLSFTTTAATGMMNESDIIITVNGTNTLISGNSADVGFGFDGSTTGVTLQGTGSFTVTTLTTEATANYAFRTGNLTIDGITLNANAYTASTSVFGILVDQDLIVNNGGTVSGYASGASESVGIQVNGTATVSDGVITGEGSVMGYQGNNPITTDGTTEATIYDSDGNALTWVMGGKGSGTYTTDGTTPSTYITNVNGNAPGAFYCSTWTDGQKINVTWHGEQFSGTVGDETFFNDYTNAKSKVASTSDFIVVLESSTITSPVSYDAQNVYLTCDDAVYTRMILGGELISGSHDYTGSYTVNIEGGTYMKEVAGGDASNRFVSRTGDITLNISGGVFVGHVLGGSYYSAKSALGSAVEIGDINLTISGGTFQQRVYGGCGAISEEMSSRAAMEGDVYLTIDATTNAIEFQECVAAGNRGYGLLLGSTNVTVTGLGSNLTFADNSVLFGGCGKDYYRVVSGVRVAETSVIDPTTWEDPGVRALTFDQFTGDFNAEIRMFSDITFENNTVLNFTDTALDLQDISNWNFDCTSTASNLTKNKFANDTIAVDTEALTEGSWTLLSGDAAAFADLGSATSVSFSGSTATWSGSAWSDGNFSLAVENQTDLVITKLGKIA